MHGRWFCSAISCARRCFLTVIGKYVPPLTVASLATITHCCPSTTPIPGTIPAPGAWPSYMSHAARAESSRKALSGSTRRSTRSRAVSFPLDRWRSTAFGPPPWATCPVRQPEVSMIGRRSALLAVAAAFVLVLPFSATADSVTTLVDGTAVLLSQGSGGNGGNTSSTTSSTNIFSPAAYVDYKRFGGEPTVTGDRYPHARGTP